MQTSLFQSMPCVSEDLARAQVASMMTQLTSEKKQVRLINIDIRESNGMFIAVATYEVTELLDEVKEEDKKGEGDSQNTGNPEEEDHDAEGAVLHHTLHPHEIVQQAPDLKNGDLPPAQSEPTAFEPVTQTNLTEPAQEVALPPTGPDALQPDAEFLADKMKDDFVEAETYNVDESELIAERAASATAGMNAEEMAALKAEIDKKLAAGLTPESILPDGGTKPSATPPGSAT